MRITPNNAPALTGSYLDFYQGDPIETMPTSNRSVKLMIWKTIDLQNKKIETWAESENKVWEDEYNVIIEDWANEMKKTNGQCKRMKLPQLHDFLKLEAPRFERQDIIGTGSFSTIYTLNDLPNYVEKYPTKGLYYVNENKMGIYASFSNPNLFVKYFGRFGSGEAKSMLMERCESDMRDQLNAIITKIPKGDPERPNEIRKVLYALSTFLPQALLELDHLGIIHGDIKLENIMICNGSLKLGDFDNAVFKSEIKQQRDLTRDLRSPLSLKGIPDPNKDLYAAGKTILDALRYTQKRSKYVSDSLYFPEPSKSKMNDYMLYLRIVYIVYNISTKILSRTDNVRTTLKKLLYQYLVKWENGLDETV